MNSYITGNQNLLNIYCNRVSLIRVVLLVKLKTRPFAVLDSIGISLLKNKMYNNYIILSYYNYCKTI